MELKDKRECKIYSNGKNRLKCMERTCQLLALQGMYGDFCQSHSERPLCIIEGCRRQRVKSDFCMKHGGYKRICKVNKCDKCAFPGGFCVRHGGRATMCKIENCNKYSVSKGLCLSHGAERTKCSII